MSEDRSWEGNWKARRYERVRERGYDSLTAFANARPTASLVALAEELGSSDIAGVATLPIPMPSRQSLGRSTSRCTIGG